MTRSFSLTFSKVSSGIRDLQLSGAFLSLTKPTVLLGLPGAGGSSGAGGGITNWVGLMSVPFPHLRPRQKCFQKHCEILKDPGITVYVSELKG